MPNENQKIGNDGVNVDTDSYNTLTSELAKSEYSNVESSMNKRENEESEMLAREVNPEKGELTKSLTKANQITADGKNTLEKNDKAQQNFIDQNSKQQALQRRKNEKYDKEAEALVYADRKSTADTSPIWNLHFAGKPGKLQRNAVNKMFFKPETLRNVRL